jgi:hypothetical protein
MSACARVPVTQPPVAGNAIERMPKACPPGRAFGASRQEGEQHDTRAERRERDR